MQSAYEAAIAKRGSERNDSHSCSLSKLVGIDAEAQSAGIVMISFSAYGERPASHAPPAIAAVIVKP